MLENRYISLVLSIQSVKKLYTHICTLNVLSKIIVDKLTETMNTPFAICNIYNTSDGIERCAEPTAPARRYITIMSFREVMATILNLQLGRPSQALCGR